MINIRKGVFETNSSSSHSLVVCNEETWLDFTRGKLFYNTLHESNGLPEFCTLKDIKLHIRRIYNSVNRTKFADLDIDDEARKDVYHGIHELLFFEETFYSIDELEEYEYNSDKQEASLSYYFG